MDYENYKDAPPMETVAVIKKCLSDIGLVIEESVDERLNNIFSASLSETVGGWGTAGKGTTREYCLASGYGEMMEHLSNYYAYDTTVLKKETLQYAGFERYPDEVTMLIRSIREQAPDVFADMKQSFEMDGDHADQDDEIYAVWEALLGQNTIFVPYYSVKQRKEVLLPELVVYNLCGSNGGSAGNSHYEALGHAFDEIIERYVKYQIYSEKLTPPDIPMSFIQREYRELHNVIVEIKEKTGFDIYIKDASLGLGFSVVCVLIVDKIRKRHMANFGAHPVFQIALERCLTEMFQSFSVTKDSSKRKKMTRWHATTAESFACTKNWVSLLRDDCGYLPNSFFAGNVSWEFVPWPKMPEYSNEIGMRYQLEKLMSMGGDV